jgi:hypothetical protein
MFNPIVKYGVGGLVCGLMAFGAYFTMRLSSADAATRDAAGLSLRAVPMACAPAIQKTVLNPMIAVPGKACACVQQQFLAALTESERAPGADMISLIALTERAADRGVSADLSPYFEGVQQIQQRHALDGHAMGGLVERVNAALEVCAAR